MWQNQTGVTSVPAIHPQCHRLSSCYVHTYIHTHVWDFCVSTCACMCTYIHVCRRVCVCKWPLYSPFCWMHSDNGWMECQITQQSMVCCTVATPVWKWVYTAWWLELQRDRNRVWEHPLNTYRDRDIGDYKVTSPLGLAPCDVGQPHPNRTWPHISHLQSINQRVENNRKINVASLINSWIIAKILFN